MKSNREEGGKREGRGREEGGKREGRGEGSFNPEGL
jgi:hypothetical protein